MTNPPQLEATALGSLFPFLGPPQKADEIGRLEGYRLLQPLGEGGMGVVFQAEDECLCPVALKVMKPELSSNSVARQRFLCEAQTAAAIKNEHIVGIYDIREEAVVPFYAMELLKGMSLYVYLNRGKRMKCCQILRLGKEIALGLAAVHEKGMVHRDVKPANIWLEAPTGLAKLFDFGVVCQEKTGTPSGTVVGTPAYMAPEQARGEPVDARSDLFSLGCVLYRVVTGELPFQGPTKLDTLAALLAESPRPPEEAGSNVLPPLSELV